METAFRSEQRFTQAEFFDWLGRRPRGDIHHYELLAGHIVMTPPAGYPHGAIEVRISAALLAFVDPRGLGAIHGSSAGYELPTGDTVEPDVSFVSSATLAAGPKPVMGRFMKLVPTLAIEILSRSTMRRDRHEKKAIYERCGVGEYWIVSPERRHVEVFCRRGAKFSKPLLVVRGSVRSTVLEGLELPLDAIFADLV